MARNNAIIGLFLLVFLAIFAGPNAFPRLASSFAPFIDEGVPCSRLREGDDRTMHQSLIGREASSEDEPISVRISASDIPQNPQETFTIKVIVVNESVGTIPIVYPGDLLVNTANVNGIGIVFNNATIPPAASQPGLIPDSNIRLLMPRQRCVERYTATVSQLAALGVGPTSTVRAFYRNSTNGISDQTGGSNVIFNNQGLWVGVAQSELVSLRIASGTAQ